MLSRFLFSLEEENENLEKYFQLGSNVKEEILKISNQSNENMEGLFQILDQFHLNRDQILKKIFETYRNLKEVEKRGIFKKSQSTKEELKKYQKSFFLQKEKKKKLIQMILNQDEKIFLLLKNIQQVFLKNLQESLVRKKRIKSYKCDLSFTRLEKNVNHLTG